MIVMPRDKTKGYYSVIMEFKYLKKQEEKMLKEKKKEAKEQLEDYCKLNRIKDIPNLRKYTIVAVVDKIHEDEIK